MLHRIDPDCESYTDSEMSDDGQGDYTATSDSSSKEPYPLLHATIAILCTCTNN